MNPQTSLRQRIGWIDLLRITACFMMVLAHCCDPFVAQFDANRTEFLSGAFIGSLMRACVPLFVMMTGVLLLPVTTDAGPFYRKRIGRILLALVFWSLALPVLYYLYLNNVTTASPSITAGDFTGSATLHKLWTFLLNFTYDTTPLWYLYMLVGLYFILPILSAWLEKVSKRDLHILLSIWGFTLLLPYMKLLAAALGYTGNYGNMGLFGVCDWNEFGTFHYVSGFAGYLLLAYYLVKYPPLWSLRRTLAICLPAFAAGYAITALGFVLTQKYYPSSYANLEIVWYFSGINVALMTASLFILIQRCRIRPQVWLSRLAGATFGIYLCHFILVQVSYDLLGGIAALPAAVRILLMSVVAFGSSWFIVALMQRFRLTRKFVE